jgi:YegS/Rv2252/BmrU family lipid kinase
MKYVFIINPSKRNYKLTQKEISKYFSRVENLNKYEISFKYTTIENPGQIQAREAVNENADLVIAVGGDGTQRAVASALVDTKIPLGIIPIGTANIFARNLCLPINDVNSALDIITKNKCSFIDVGELIRKEEPGISNIFIVVAGAGIDATMIHMTSDKLKNRIGFFAYFLSMIKNRNKEKFIGDIIIRNEMSNKKEISISGIPMKTTIVGNCSRIPGFSLFPDALYNDSLLDIAIINTRLGILGWYHLFIDIFLQKFGFELISNAARQRIKKFQITSITLETNKDIIAHIDGDIVGKTKNVTIKVRHNSLKIIVP